MKTKQKNQILFELLSKQIKFKDQDVKKKAGIRLFRDFIKHKDFYEEDQFNNVINIVVEQDLIDYFLQFKKLKYHNLCGSNLKTFSLQFDLKGMKDSQELQDHKTTISSLLYKIFQHLSKSVQTLSLYLDDEIMNVQYILKIVYSYTQVNKNLKNLTLKIKNSSFDVIAKGIAYITDRTPGLTSVDIQFMNLKNLPNNLEKFDQILLNVQDCKEFGLKLKGCNVTQKELVYLGEKIKLFNNLKKLKLIFFKNQINDEGVKQFAKSLSDLSEQITSLKIDMYWNQITDFGAAHLIGELTQFQQLASLQLNLGNNKITDHTILFECLCQFQNLVTLGLNFRKFKVEFDEIESFEDQFEHLLKLQEIKLDFSYNKIDYRNITQILNYLRKLPKLNQIKLILKSCKFDQNQVQSILNQITHIKNLQKLIIDLSWNDFTDKQLQQLIDKFSEMENKSSKLFNHLIIRKDARSSTEILE